MFICPSKRKYVYKLYDIRPYKKTFLKDYRNVFFYILFTWIHYLVAYPSLTFLQFFFFDKALFLFLQDH